MTEKLPYKFLLALLVFAIQPVFGQTERSYSFEDISLDPDYQTDILDAGVGFTNMNEDVSGKLWVFGNGYHHYLQTRTCCTEQ